MNKRKQCESRMFKPKEEFNRMRLSGRIKRFHKMSNGWHYASLQRKNRNLIIQSNWSNYPIDRKILNVERVLEIEENIWR